MSHAQQFRSYLGQRLRKLSAQQFVRDLADGLGFGVSQHRLRSAAPKQDLPLHIDHKDGVLREFKQGSLLRSRYLLLPPLRNVAEDQHNANDFSFAGEDWRGAVLDRNFAAISCDQVHVVGHSQIPASL